MTLPNNLDCEPMSRGGRGRFQLRCLHPATRSSSHLQFRHFRFRECPISLKGSDQRTEQPWRGSADLAMYISDVHIGSVSLAT